jgi:hypothetical protein
MLSAGGGLQVAREKQSAREKADSSVSNGARMEARFPAKGSHSSVVACRNAGESEWLRVAGERERHEADVRREAAQRKGEVAWGHDHRDAEFTALSQNVTEWYFPITVHSSGYCDLSVL